jgi:hypothetical protein
VNPTGLSVDIIVRQLGQVLEPYHMMFEELKDRKMQLPSQCFCKGKKNTKKY